MSNMTDLALDMIDHIYKLLEREGYDGVEERRRRLRQLSELTGVSVRRLTTRMKELDLWPDY